LTVTNKSNQMREMPIHDRGWISSAQSYFCIHFRYKFLRVAVKLRLLMLKTNKKDKIWDQKNLLTNFIFLKVVVSNIRDAFDKLLYISWYLITFQTFNIIQLSNASFIENWKCQKSKVKERIRRILLMQLCMKRIRNYSKYSFLY